MKRAQVLIWGFLAIIILPIFLVWWGASLSQRHRIEFTPVQKAESWNPKDIALNFAPFLVQETTTAPVPKYWDFIGPMNFDGDWEPINNANNNQHTQGKNLQACLYYSLLETQSHFFIHYLAYYPLNWEVMNRTKIYRRFENDLLHMQVVIAKSAWDNSNGVIEFVGVQCYDYMEQKYFLEFYKNPTSSLDISRVQTKNLVLANENGQLDVQGTHPVFFIRSGSHQLANLSSKEIAKPPYLLPKNGILYFPSMLEHGEVPETFPSKASYALFDIHEVLWDPDQEKNSYQFFKKNHFEYKDTIVSWQKIPVIAGGSKLNNNVFRTQAAAISPFSFGKYTKKVKQGSFFFNPVKAYKDLLGVHGWSVKYIYHPYANQDL